MRTVPETSKIYDPTILFRTPTTTQSSEGDNLCERYYEGDAVFCCEGCHRSDCPRCAVNASPKEVANIENKSSDVGPSRVPSPASSMPRVKDGDYL